MEDLLVEETRTLKSTDGQVWECAASVLVWQAFDELIAPPINMDRYELIDRAAAIYAERLQRNDSGASFYNSFDASFENVVTTFHSQIAPPWSMKSLHIKKRPV